MEKLVKVRCHPGAYINDMYNYLMALTEKKPDSNILMMGTNDAVNKCSQQILNELLNLKSWLLENLPWVKLVFSCPTVRYDNQKARLTILQLRNKLQQLRNKVLLAIII